MCMTCSRSNGHWLMELVYSPSLLMPAVMLFPFKCANPIY